MHVKNIALVLGLVLSLVFLSSNVNAVPDEVCVKQTKGDYYFPSYTTIEAAPVPDSKIVIGDKTGYYVVFTGFHLVDEGPWGPRLNLKVTYCDSRTKKIAYEGEVHPGGYLEFSDYAPVISYRGPITAPLNTRCLMVGVKEEKFSALNSLMFSGTRSAPETLLFKRVLSRTAQATKIISSKTVKPRATSVVGRNNPRPLDEPEVDPDAQNSCYAKVFIG